MAATDICLKWSSHHNALASLLCSQLESKKLVDVTIAAEGKCINVHRLVLCASSPYFENLLGQFSKPTVVILQNIKFADVQSIIEYIYKGEVSLSKEQLASFLEAAKCLQIKGLNHEEKIPDQVQEETAADGPSPDSIRLNQEEEESAGDDDLDKTMMYEAEENSNQEPCAIPMVINLDESMVEEKQNNSESDKENLDNSTVMMDDDLLQSEPSDGEERDSTRSKSKSNKSTKKKEGKADSNRSQPLKCGVCGRDCKNKFLLKQHTLKGNCQSVPYFRCAVCGTCINTRSDLRRHLSRLHKNVKASQIDDHIIEVEPTLTCRKDLVSLQKHKKKKKNDGET